MIDNPGEVAALLDNTVLGGRPVEVLGIPEHETPAFAIAIAPGEIIAGWTAARMKLEELGRWPVAATSWGRGPIDPAELFSRVPYQARTQRTAAPSAVLARAEAISATEFIASRVTTLGQSEPLVDWMDHELGETQAKFGVSPPLEDLSRAIREEGLKSRVDLDRWLFNWELANINESASLEPPDLWYQQWYQPTGQQVAIVLLPTPHPWEVLAFMSWWASELAGGNEPLIAVLHDWHERFGAELVAHWGTMLQIVTSLRPDHPDEAWRLALEHEVIAPYTLQNYPLREHARTLLRSDRWFLHERP